jgi:glyoxylase-like metal-dependent hydrolase (beta-lactamase superfamily II)
VTRILVDCGLGIRTLERRLAIAGLGTDDIDGLFITHEHSDHVGCAHTLALRERIPVWMSEGTWSARGGLDYEGLLNTREPMARPLRSVICWCSLLHVPARRPRTAATDDAPTAPGAWAC